MTRKNKQIIAVILLVVLLVVRGSSETLALRRAGLRSQEQEIYHGFDSDGREVRAIRTETSDGKTFATALLTKNRLGFWRVTLCDIADESHPHWTDLGWLADGGDVLQSGRIEKMGFINHYVLCGDNAQKQIYFEDGQLPDNAMVDFSQSTDGAYWIHITYCLLPGADGAHFSVYQALMDNGCIPAE